MQSPDIQENLPVQPQKSLWSPTAIFWISLLFTPIPATAMVALNFGQLGQLQKQKLWLFYAFIGALIYCLLTFRLSLAGSSRLPGLTGLSLLVFWVAIAWSLYRRQLRLFENHVRQGGNQSSVLLPVIGSLLWLGLTFGVGIGGDLMVQAQDNREFERAYALMQKEEYDEAEAIFKRIAREYPDDTTSRFNLAAIYANTDRFSLAKPQIEQILRIEPDNKEAQDLLKDLQDALEE